MAIKLTISNSLMVRQLELASVFIYLSVDSERLPVSIDEINLVLGNEDEFLL